MSKAAGRAELEMTEISVSLADSDRHFTLQIDQLGLAGGEILGLSGASGTGKTLLLEVIGLLRRPDPGGAYVATGQDLAALWDTGQAQSRAPALRGDLFGFVPQSGGLLPFLSAADNVALSQRIAGRADPARVVELLDRLGLADLATLHPDALSIGQRQRVAIARALAHRPKFLIADEPTAALDPENARAAMALLVEAAQEDEIGTILSSHDPELLQRFATRRAHLQAEAGPGPGQVLSRLAQPKAQAA